MSWPFRSSRYDVGRCSFFMHDIELLLSVVRSLTFITLQLQIWNDGALEGQMCNPPVLHSSEGQKNETPGSVVSHCWPWLQVIKALLSFCQSSDSPNISPWLISAVSSVRVYTGPWKDQHRVSVLHFTIRLSIPSSMKADQITLWYHFWPPLLWITTNVSSSAMSRYCASAGQRELFHTDWRLKIYCGLRWASCDFVKWCFSSNHRHFCCPGSTPSALNHRAEWYRRAVICQISPPLVRPMNEDGHPEVW